METTPEQTKWIRLPKVGCYCTHSRLSRSSLYIITKRGDVESRMIYPTGGSRGVLIINHASLMAFLERQVSGATDNNSHLQGRKVVATDHAPVRPIKTAGDDGGRGKKGGQP